MLAVGNDAQFAASAAPATIARGRPALRHNGVARNRDALIPILERFTAARTSGVAAALVELGIPAGPIHDMSQVFDDPQARDARCGGRRPPPRRAP